MKEDYPDTTVWERFASEEYQQLAMEEEEREQEEAQSDGSGDWEVRACPCTRERLPTNV